MHTWPTRVGSVLQMLDPSVGPRLVLERLWLEVSNWNTIGGIWLNIRSGHLTYRSDRARSKKLIPRQIMVL